MESASSAKIRILLDSVILEGKADTFASIIYPDANAPWAEPLSPQEEKKYGGS
jgi:hypothetical protein